MDDLLERQGANALDQLPAGHAEEEELDRHAEQRDDTQDGVHQRPESSVLSELVWRLVERLDGAGDEYGEDREEHSVHGRSYGSNEQNRRLRFVEVNEPLNGDVPARLELALITFICSGLPVLDLDGAGQTESSGEG